MDQRSEPPFACGASVPRHLALALLLLVFFAAAGRAQVLFTNFGPGFTYDTAVLDDIFGNSCVSPVSVAAEFKPSASAFFQDAKVPLGLFLGTNQLSVYLLAADGSGGRPGTIMEGPINVTGLTGSPGSVITANSSLHPLLVAGTSYWLAVIARTADTCGSWFVNSTGDLSDGSNIVSSGTSDPAGPWTFVGLDIQRPAFQIDGVSPSYQVTYVSNLDKGESWINLMNDGSQGPGGFGYVGPNALCANVYTFHPDEQLINCCQCLLTPDSVFNIGVNRDLLSASLTSNAATTTSVAVKIITSTQIAGGGCNPALVQNTDSTKPGFVASGIHAWGTTLHNAPPAVPSYQITEKPFTFAALNDGELAQDVAVCAFIQLEGSGAGQCSKVCALGALGATVQ